MRKFIKEEKSSSSNLFSMSYALDSGSSPQHCVEGVPSPKFQLGSLYFLTTH